MISETEKNSKAIRDFVTYWGVTECTVNQPDFEDVVTYGSAYSTQKYATTEPTITVTIGMRKWCALTQLATPQLDMHAKFFEQLLGREDSFGDFLRQAEYAFRMIEKHPQVKDAYDKFKLVMALVDDNSR